MNQCQKQSKSIFRIDDVSPTNEKTNCHTPTTSYEITEEKIIVNKGDEKKMKKSFADDIEPGPNVTAYGDDAYVKGEKSSSFAKDIEPRPDITVYGGDDDDAGVKGEKKSFKRQFESEPTATFYHDCRELS
ncbi:hypothetical protein DITRI_Ditri08aG0121100 [Diplodiscus trichospermus]